MSPARCLICNERKREGLCPTPAECARLSRPAWRGMNKTKNEKKARERVREMER